MSNSTERRLLLLTASVAVLAFAGAAYAQDAAHALPAGSLQIAQADTAAPAPAGPDSGEVATVVVTGSRLATGFTSPTPVTAVSAAQLDQRAVASIGEALVEIPSFRNSQSPNSVTNGTLAGSQTLLDLRGLGATRTLVLINGLRPTPINATNGYDVNLVPTSLVDHTDVVTGGASAAYGSDAVAGVVNFVLKNHLEGFTGKVQYGTSQRGDNRSTLVSLGFGHAFAGDRGHFMIGADWSKDDGIGNMYNRDWGRLEPGAVTLPTTRAAGLPATIIENNAELDANTPGGIISSGPLKGTAFDANAVPYTFSYGALAGSTQYVGAGNYGSTTYSTMDLYQPYKRAAALARADYDINSDINAFAELHFGSMIAQGTGGTCCNSVTYTVARTNPYLPASVLQQMVAANVQTIQVGRRENDYPSLVSGNQMQNWQGVFGLQGKLFGGWKWDAAYTTGSSVVKVVQLNDPLVADQEHSAYAVKDASGNIVCGPVATDPYYLAQPASTRAVLTAATDAGCQPFDVFGTAANNAAAIKYFMGANEQRLDIKQQTASANLSGEPFSLPAGPVSLAVGAEWRSNDLVAQGCPNCLLGKLQNQNFPSYAGSEDVKEAYAEVGVPLLKDLPLFKSLDLNAAVRRTDYSISGAVTTWKIGGTWDLNDWFRLRATRSRDIRAPNLSELYNPGSNGRANITNQLTGVSDVIASTTAGNPNLTPEIANTLTAGVVLQPTWSWAKGFRASIDYFQINIDGVIGSISAQNVLNGYLLQGQTQYAPFVVAANNAIGFSAVNSAEANLSSQKNDGIDFELSYRVPLEALKLPGRLDVRALGTWYDHQRTIQNLAGGTVSNIDSAGTSSGQARWSWNVTTSYAIGKISTALTTRYTSAIKYSPTLIGPDDPAYSPTLSNSINRNLWPSSLYFSWNLAYDIVAENNKRLQVYGVIDNLLDKIPPIIATVMLSGSPYDVIGRNFKVGVRFAY